ncbi:uncharacterized protein ZK1073.1-like [Saccoglossus kowalevskii]|uniref:Uncharacterized protein ZK1073.1-like n=1 Tax=Saccoglossus kowalevskii TaxID=10224 RepID=A0ABM0N063_SACKO|nr:PREDICTED: uncharacterized protein ZK1073.1-like [Saccoglossus kowalevskii]
MASSRPMERVVVKTERTGPFECYIQGDRSAKQLCVTWHDIGLNYLSFHKFTQHPDMLNVAHKMCFVHINAPGQEPDAGNLPDDFRYPSIQEFSDEVDPILDALG